MDEKIRRCAIYTRKSTEDGLEQEFNSLDAQYEACAAYALSQQHEGWVVTDSRYDDGGFSGGNMERPGLRQLLADIEAGRIDVVLLYKIDRLTRSLTDFSKIVEVMDNAGASFVSITQSFNTTTSMGRLTLNMLLSFAQFEREVTGERIRDKIAASKKKGMWMGGPVPLGYEVKDRKLVVMVSEAERVRHIMRRYIALGNVPALAEELNEQDYHRIDLHKDRIEVAICGRAIGRELELGSVAERQLSITIPAVRVRRGHQLRLIISGKKSAAAAPIRRDEKLIALIAEAFQARKLIDANPEKPIAHVASNHGRCRTRLGKLVRLSCLAPDIVTAIVKGRQPKSLTAKSLSNLALPLAWDEQREKLGFG